MVGFIQGYEVGRDGPTQMQLYSQRTHEKLFRRRGVCKESRGVVIKNDQVVRLKDVALVFVGTENNSPRKLLSAKIDNLTDKANYF